MNKTQTGVFIALASIALHLAIPTAARAADPNFDWAPLIRTVVIDERSNVIVTMTAEPPHLQQATFINGGKSRDLAHEDWGCYSIRNAAGDGVVLRDSVNLDSFQILGAGNNGIVVAGNNCNANRGIISGAKGVGVLITGSNNSLDKLYIAGCAKPVQILGSHNFVSYVVGKAPMPMAPYENVEIVPLPQNGMGK